MQGWRKPFAFAGLQMLLLVIAFIATFAFDLPLYEGGPWRFPTFWLMAVWFLTYGLPFIFALFYGFRQRPIHWRSFGAVLGACLALQVAYGLVIGAGALLSSHQGFAAAEARERGEITIESAQLSQAGQQQSHNLAYSYRNFPEGVYELTAGFTRQGPRQVIGAVDWRITGERGGQSGQVFTFKSQRLEDLEGEGPAEVFLEVSYWQQETPWKTWLNRLCGWAPPPCPADRSGRAKHTTPQLELLDTDRFRLP